MENKLTRFEKAYNALVDSYFNETLAKGTCTACAVGNIVTAALGGEIIPTSIKGRFTNTTPEQSEYWYHMFWSSGGKQASYIKDYPEDSKKLQKLTGYTARELAKVEFAFENNTKIRSDDYYCTDEQEILEDQYNGLVAVVDVLLSLEKMENNGHKEKFRQHPKLQVA